MKCHRSSTSRVVEWFEVAVLRHPHGVGRRQADVMGVVVAPSALAHGDRPQPAQASEHGDLHRHVDDGSSAAMGGDGVDQREGASTYCRARTAHGARGRRWAAAPGRCRWAAQRPGRSGGVGRHRRCRARRRRWHGGAGGESPLALGPGDLSRGRGCTTGRVASQPLMPSSGRWPSGMPARRRPGRDAVVVAGMPP